MASFCSCNKCGKKMGTLTQQSESLSGFHSIEVNGAFGIELVQDSTFGLEINGGEGQIENVFFDVVDSVLYIRNENRCAFLNNYNNAIDLKIGIGPLQKLNLLNPRSLVSSDTIRSEFLELNIEECALETELILNTRIIVIGLKRGTPTLTLKGKCESMVLTDVSYGHFYAYQFQCESVSLDCQGTGLTEVYASKNFNARHLGSGIIRYKGNPTSVKTEIGEYSTAQIVKAD
jgi:hypothetical protein